MENKTYTLLLDPSKGTISGILKTIPVRSGNIFKVFQVFIILLQIL